MDDSKKKSKSIKLISELEQMRGYLTEIARTVGAYHADLVANGLTRYEALDATRDLQETLIEKLNDDQSFLGTDEDEED